MLRAQLLGGTPSELLGAITGLTEARFPVYAAAHFADGFPTVRTRRGGSRTLVGTTIYAPAGAPVIASQDGEVEQVGDSPTLGHYVRLRDAYGNQYTYARLGSIAARLPRARAAPQLEGQRAGRRRRARTGPERSRHRRRAAALAGQRGRDRLGPRAGRSGEPGIGAGAGPRPPAARQRTQPAPPRRRPSRRTSRPSAKAPTRSTCTRCAPACR